MLTRACAYSVVTAVRPDYVFHQLSTHSAFRARNGGREIFLCGSFLNVIFLKLYPISIHGSEVVMHGFHTDSVNGACLNVGHVSGL